MQTDHVPVVVYDASVLFPFQIAHILTFLAFDRLVRAHWTADIEAEWVERSLAKLSSLDRTSIEKRRDLMNAALPDAKVRGYAHRIDGLVFPDPDDRHVVAAALECGACAIVTADKAHFTVEALRPYGLTRLDPDDLLSERLTALPELMVETADRARRSLTRSCPDWRGYIDILKCSGLPAFSENLRQHLRHMLSG